MKNMYIFKRNYRPCEFSMKLQFQVNSITKNDILLFSNPQHSSSPGVFKVFSIGFYIISTFSKFYKTDKLVLQMNKVCLPSTRPMRKCVCTVFWFSFWFYLLSLLLLNEWGLKLNKSRIYASRLFSICSISCYLFLITLATRMVQVSFHSDASSQPQIS